MAELATGICEQANDVTGRATLRGNMRRVFLECAERQRIEQIARERARRNGSALAEIMPGVEPIWHVVVTHPGRDLTASAHLVARRFGIYQPDIECNCSNGARRIERMFPGYVFVFVWDIEAHARRIEACSGVSRILRLSDGRPAQVEDREVDWFQAQEFGRLALSANRNRRKLRTAAFNPDIPKGAARISTKGYLGELAAMDSGGRIGVLHAALGLSS